MRRSLAAPVAEIPQIRQAGSLAVVGELHCQAAHSHCEPGIRGRWRRCWSREAGRGSRRGAADRWRWGREPECRWRAEQARGAWIGREEEGRWRGWRSKDGRRGGLHEDGQGRTCRGVRDEGRNRRSGLGWRGQVYRGPTANEQESREKRDSQNQRTSSAAARGLGDDSPLIPLATVFRGKRESLSTSAAEGGARWVAPPAIRADQRISPKRQAGLSELRV